jgi:hypothetical protein
MLEIFWNESLLGYSAPGEGRVGAPSKGRRKPLGTDKDERNGSTGGGRVYSQYRPGWQNGILAEVAGFRSNPPAKYFLKG